MLRTARSVLLAFAVAAISACGSGDGTTPEMPPEPPPPPPAEDTLDTSFLRLGAPGTYDGFGSVTLRPNSLNVAGADVIESFGDDAYVLRPGIPVTPDSIVIRGDVNRFGRVVSTEDALDETGSVRGLLVTTVPATLDELIEEGNIGFSATPDWRDSSTAAMVSRAASTSRAWAVEDGKIVCRDLELFKIVVNRDGQVDWGECTFAEGELDEDEFLGSTTLDWPGGGTIRGYIPKLEILVNPTLQGQIKWLKGRLKPAFVAARVDAMVAFSGSIVIEADGEVDLQLGGEILSLPPIPLPTPLPSVLHLDLGAGVALHFEGSGSVELGLDSAFSLFLDATYHESTGVALSKGSDFLHNSPTADFSGTFSANAKFFLDLRTTVRFLEVVGPFFTLQPYLAADFELPWKANKDDLFLGILGEAGLNVGLPLWNYDIVPAQTLFDTQLLALDIYGPRDDSPRSVANRSPVAQDLSLRTSRSREQDIELPGSDLDGDVLSWRVLTEPVEGSLTPLIGNRLSYLPGRQNTQDSFYYQVEDGRGGKATGFVRIEILDSAPPTADFEFALTSRTLTVEPACTDVEGPPSSLQFRWDWENDGAWDTLWLPQGPHVHAYPKGGPHTVAMEVRDSSGLTARRSRVISPHTSSTDTFVGIATGRHHGVAVDKDGRVWTWGLNGSRGALGDGGTRSRYAPQRLAFPTNVTAVAAGNNHTLLLDAAGAVWAFGENSEGELGDGSTSDRGTPRKVSGLPVIVAVAAGSRFSLALDGTGKVWGWGEHRDNQLGLDTWPATLTNQSTPRKSPYLSRIVKLRGGDRHAVAIDEVGAVWTWGDNTYGQLGIGSAVSRFSEPTRISGLQRVTDIAAGDNFCLAVADGEVWGWGTNRNGETGIGSDYPDEQTAPRRTGILGAISVWARDSSGFAILEDGRVVGWGQNSSGELGVGYSSWEEFGPLPQHLSPGTAALAVGPDFSIALRSGNLWAVGANRYGELGLGDLIARTVPTRISR